VSTSFADPLNYCVDNLSDESLRVCAYLLTEVKKMSNYQVGDIVDVRMTICKSFNNGIFTGRSSSKEMHYTLPERDIVALVKRASSARVVATAGEGDIKVGDILTFDPLVDPFVERRVDVDDVTFRTGDEVQLKNVIVISNEPNGMIYVRCPANKLRLIHKSLVSEVIKRAETPEEKLAAFEVLAKTQAKLLGEQSKNITDLVRLKHQQADVIRHWETVSEDVLRGRLMLVWAAWRGGECPINPEELCFVKLRNGLLKLNKACMFNWSAAAVSYDIVMYAPVSVPQ
jgi:hypothetical protein